MVEFDLQQPQWYSLIQDDAVYHLHHMLMMRLLADARHEQEQGRIGSFPSPEASHSVGVRRNRPRRASVEINVMIFGLLETSFHTSAGLPSRFCI